MCQVPVHRPPSEAGGKGICTSSRDSAKAKRPSGSLRISGSSDRCGRFGSTRSQCLTGWNGRILSGGNGGERSAFSPSSVSQCGVGIRRANSSQKRQHVMVRRALVLVPGGQVVIMGLGWKHGGGLGSPCIGTCVSAFPLMRRQRETLGRFSAWYWIASNRPWLCDPGKEAQEPMYGSPASFDFGLGRGRQQPDDDMLCSTWGRTKIALSVPA
ncbi:uncharacterized protein CCOS01_05874 [Colletotrichum costaricense]|uniref:Uncharacterized protein n=1 Tax=Colletotrichum costaricense TaxID=1209916 RepID=A0AAJ0E285_9PEZI|nr:uncharacterized protein CCOS01_05874 [Colletotrichum costaricense]KAK1530771.1 hypothetical protein CCOS01_05874 [Colletotrichum costaricense]